MVLKNYKFKTKKFFKQKTINKNSFLYPYLYIFKIKENFLIDRNKIVILNEFISKIIKKFGQIKINSIFLTGYTKKNIGIRMGKGKADISGYNYSVKKGFSLIEIESSNKNLFNKINFKKISILIPCFIYIVVCSI